MGATDLFIQLAGRGFTLTAKEDGRLYVAPSYALTDNDRNAIRAHRDELLHIVKQAPRSVLPPELVRAVTRLCELRSDEPAHCEAVLAELRTLPPEQHSDMAAMFKEQVHACEEAAAEAIRQAAERIGGASR